MEPNRLGRIIGIGTRVAADKLRDRYGESAVSLAATTSTAPSPEPSRPAPKLIAHADGARRFAQGAGRFTSTLVRPFAHATGILILQITGLFFAFFAVGFSFYSFKLYKVAGWRDHHLPLYAAFAVLFAWFAVSSFWRASRKQKRA